MHSETESVFSMVKKIDTDSRSDLGQDTICALLSCKLNPQLFSVSAFRRTAEVCYAYARDPIGIGPMSATWQHECAVFAEGY